MRETLCEWENTEVNRLRDELRILLSVLAEREKLMDIGWGTDNSGSRSKKKLREAVKLCKGYCKSVKPLDEYGREANGDIQARCITCTFPSCETCGHESEKPVPEKAKSVQTGAWYI